MTLNPRIELIELTDDELKAVAGGFSVTNTNSTVANSFNNSGNISVSNSLNILTNSLNNGGIG